MAKKINNTEDVPQGDVQSSAMETAEQVNLAEAKDTTVQETDKVETKTDETATEKQKEAKKEEKEESTNPHILDILKKFPAYESIYIDSHGGTFSPDTPAAIRRDAVLYKNPYYNELKRQS